ncbi:MAG: ATP-binding protein [Rothia sp. (in: high G+C Gram-positive bacteria)]|uniref:RNA-binding domain-containing protein n=1 Tax=Rothia sp. (in: high G+C Gram-positive bacteria) TaxID=1885016 RepID=UPI0026DA9D48|nr:RNA-binding domain-containing protein [Rothia sp. (in: high G+C Gram-positive bacteria)]MDO4883390.1 ATP-binding protein [Rothia sp. (in: high G+C Gram-positive bacteria)]
MSTHEWTPERLENTLLELRRYGSDTHRLEVKKARDGYPKSLDDTLCSFSNIHGGGTIICGVAEKENFKPVGVYDIAQLEKTIASKLRKQLVPPNTCACYRVEYGGHDILVIEIPGLSASQRPARIGKDYYVRVGDGDHLMDEYEVTLMLSQRERRNYDAEPVEYTSPQNLDSELADSYVSSVRRTSARITSAIENEQVLKRKRVIALGDGENLTLAGLYALGDYPQQFFPSLKVTGVVVDPEGRVRNLDKFEADGPIPFMLQETLAWLERNLRRPVRQLENGHLVNGEEIPAVALREIVANALVHRSLNPNTYTHEVQVRVLPHEVQIVNPGGLWGITDDDLQKYGTHSRVNPLLYDICTVLRVPGEGYRVIEGEGSGIPTAQEAVRAAGLKPIRFIDGTTKFTAVLSRETAPESEEHADVQQHIGEPAPKTREEAILAALRAAARPMTVEELYRYLPREYSTLNKAQIRYTLNKLIALNSVAREGGQGSRNTVYKSV